MFFFAGVLRMMTEMFLPHISLEDLEQTFFSKVLPKVGQLQLTVELSVSPVLEPAWNAVILLLRLHNVIILWDTKIEIEILPFKSFHSVVLNCFCDCSHSLQ